MGREVFDATVSVAAGAASKSESLGHQEFILTYKTFDPVGPACLPASAAPRACGIDCFVSDMTELELVEAHAMNSITGNAVVKKRKVGKTSLEVTALSLGSAPLGGLYHDLSEADAQATVDAAWQSGIRFFDTAPHYGHTKAEHRLGDALRRYPREDYVLSTKVGRRFVPRTTPYDGSEGWSNPLPFQAIYDYTYDGILRSFEDSQQRLGIVDIDIVLIHDIGRVTHGEKNALYWRQLTDEGGFRALDELRSSRGVKAVGLGVNEGAAIQEAMAEFDIDCALLAGRYTLLEQAVLDDLLPECEKRGVSILLGGAFNSGILARGLTHDTPPKADQSKVQLRRCAAVDCRTRRCAGTNLPCAWCRFVERGAAVSLCA